MTFSYKKSIFATPVKSSIAQAVFRLKKVLPEFIFDTVKLEGNPYTFPEVQTLLDGVTVGGHKLSDQEQILQQRASYVELIHQVNTGGFDTGVDTWIKLNAILAKGEALKVGQLRDGKVSIAGTAYEPPSWEELPRIFAADREEIESLKNPIERAYAFSASAALNQFFYDGNKRTGRLIMNGVLISHGIDALTIPAAKQLDYNIACLRLYNELDATSLFSLMMERHKQVGLELEALKATKVAQPTAPAPAAATRSPMASDQQHRAPPLSPDETRVLSLASAAKAATEAYHAAHHGQEPPNPEALIPYFATPQEGADWVELIDRQKGAEKK